MSLFKSKTLAMRATPELQMEDDDPFDLASPENRREEETKSEDASHARFREKPQKIIESPVLTRNSSMLKKQTKKFLSEQEIYNIVV